MEQFYNKFSFMVIFMIFIVLFNMFLGEKPTYYFLLLILFGMVVLNVDDVKSIFNKLEG